MMKTARNLDVAIVVSGDGDFAPAIRAVQEMGVRCEVISFRGNTSSDLIEVADLFTDITQIAKVEKGSSRSGRRVADDDEDLSMTEVPDKQTEGTGVGRGRGRGRGRGSASRSRSPRPARPAPRPGPAAAGAGRPRRAGGDAPGLVALPGEKLSRSVGPLPEADLAACRGLHPRRARRRREILPARPPGRGIARTARAAPAPPPWRPWSRSRPGPGRGASQGSAGGPSGRPPREPVARAAGPARAGRRGRGRRGHPAPPPRPPRSTAVRLVLGHPDRDGPAARRHLGADRRRRGSTSRRSRST